MLFNNPAFWPQEALSHKPFTTVFFKSKAFQFFMDRNFQVPRPIGRLHSLWSSIENGEKAGWPPQQWTFGSRTMNKGQPMPTHHPFNTANFASYINAAEPWSPMVKRRNETVDPFQPPFRLQGEA